MIAKEEIRDFELFADLSEKELEMVAAVTDREIFPTGARLFSEGEQNGTLYGVVRGGLRIDKRVQADVEQTLCRIDRGDFFGEVGFINGGRHSASALAENDTEVFKISRRDFDALAEKDSRLGYKMTLRLAGKIGRSLIDMDEQYLSLSRYVWGRAKG